MEKVQCVNCKEYVYLKKIEKGAVANCDCGCIQKCIDYNEHISRWRVLNPFSFEDRR